jgi:hypothetical protein
MAADIKDIQQKALDAYKQSIPSAGKIDKNRFNVKITQYPSDLQTAVNLKHYVLFNVNIRGKSKFNPDKVLFETKRNPNSANLTKDQLSSNSIKTAAVGAGAAAAGIAVGVTVTSLASGAAKVAGKTGAAAVAANEFAQKAGTAAGIAGAAVIGTAMATSDLLRKDTTYRISDAIALHVDGPPTVKYSMNYANKELGTLLGALSGGVIDNILGLGGEAGAAMGASLAKLPGAMGAADVASAMSAASGTSLNPFKETVFESVDFRSFAFKYKFYPKNKIESDAVYNIINTFKFHMHPEMSDGKFFFIYPSEFDITYYFGSEENGYFHKFATCALESMDVSYGGEQFSSFRDGSPTEINMSLTFRELEILTKRMITEGY